MPTPHRLACLGLLLLAACRFENRAPGGDRRDEAALGTLAEGFYGALGRRDSAALRRLVFAGANVMVDGGTHPLTLVPLETMLRVPERRSAGEVVRIIRTELRVDGDLATLRVVVAARRAAPAGELEASDLLTLGWRDGRWHVAHVLFGPWRSRTAP